MNLADREVEEREFDVMMARHGICVPMDRRAGALAAYRELRRMADQLRQPRNAASEPANIFSLPTILRGE